MNNKKIVLIMYMLLISISTLGCIEEPINNINAELDKADSNLDIAWDAIYRGDYEIAKTKTYSAHSYIDAAFREFQAIENELSEDDKIYWRTIFELYRTDVDLTLSTIDWFIDSDVLMDILLFDEFEQYLIKLELHIRRTEELSEKWNNYANNLAFIQRTQPDFGITDKDISDAQEWASMFEEFAQEDRIFLDESIALILDFIPIDDRIIQPIVDIPPVSEEIIPSDLARFFDGFDTNWNMELDLGEAQDFFYWVEDNIIYRWDDENRKDGWGFPVGVGDGRPGADFVQTPYETWRERAGDCEDMAIIQVAFFNHFGISAYVASVNAEGREIDHAIAIAAIGGTPEEFANMLGELVYYELEGGYYMLVDNAYSDAFGFLCGGLREGQFYILEKLTLEEEMYKHRGI